MNLKIESITIRPTDLEGGFPRKNLNFRKSKIGAKNCMASAAVVWSGLYVAYIPLRIFLFFLPSF